MLSRGDHRQESGSEVVTYVRVGLRRTKAWLRRQLAPSVIILLYHRVAELPSDPCLLSVSPRHFAEHLEILRRHYRPISLPDLSESLRHRKVPRGGVVITFDDGYADNVLRAKALLERHDIPATVFVTAGYVGQEREFWWDELEKVLLQPGWLPSTLRLKLNGAAYQWELGTHAYYAQEAFEHQRSWNVLQEVCPGTRQELYRSLFQLLRPLPDAHRRELLDELVSWAGVDYRGRQSHRALSSNELKQLADGELVEVGAHTVTHPVLSAQTWSAQRAEIEDSRTFLEAILGRPVRSFAYPYGSRADYSFETVALVREAGFSCACSNFEGVVRCATDLFQLPRAMVFDWDGDTFSRHLRTWFAR